MREIHLTDFERWRKCRRLYDFESIMRIAPAEQEFPLRVGQAVHTALAEFYRNGTNIRQTWEQEALSDNLLNDDTVYLGDLLDYYQEVYAENDAKWNILSVEEPLKYEFEGITLVGTVDLLIKENGIGYIVDHKTYSTMPDEEYLDINEQITAYLWLAQRLDLGAEKFIVNVIRKAPIKEPRVLKNGSLSRDVSQLTSAKLYTAAVKRLGLNYDEYADVIAALSQRPDPWLRRVVQWRNTAELQNFEERLWKMLDEMVNGHTYPNFSYYCSWCPYRLLCKCIEEGGDWELMIERNFRRKEPDER